METFFVVVAIIVVYGIVGLGRSARSGDLDTYDPVTGERKRPGWVVGVGILGAIIFVIVVLARQKWPK